MQTARVAPLWAVRPLHNTVSLSYVNNWSSPVVFLKVVAFRRKQTHFSCLHTTFSQDFSSLLPSLSLFLQHAPILEPLNRLVSFFPCGKKALISYLFVCCCFFCSCLEKFAVLEEGGGGNKQAWRLASSELCCVGPAAYLHTFCLQSLFKESDMLLIHFYWFYLSPFFLFSLPLSLPAEDLSLLLLTLPYLFFSLKRSQ